MNALLAANVDVDYETRGMGLCYMPRSAMHASCDRGYKDIVIALINAYAEVHCSYGFGGPSETPLGICIDGGHHDIASILIDAGAPPRNAPDPIEGVMIREGKGKGY